MLLCLIIALFVQINELPAKPLELDIEPDDDGYYHVGDLILSPGQYQRAYGDSTAENDFELDSGLRDEAFRWKDGILPYKFRPQSISTENKNKMRKVIKRFNDEMYGCINIREATVFDNDFVTVQAGVGCSSAVGKYGGEQFLTLDNHCFSDDTIVHEFIHSFGFWHEQNRPDRDQFVEIRDRFIEFGQEHNFVKRKNSLTFGLPYDGLSVMHYQSFAFSVDNTDPSKQTIISKMNNIPTEKLGKSEWLTRTDIRKLEKMYKCKPKHERIKNLVSDVGQLITGPSDVGGQCPSPTNKYTSRFGIDYCCCGDACCWDKCKYSTPPADCLQSVPNSQWIYSEELGYFQAFKDERPQVCDIITVDLKNIANELQGPRKGVYKISDTINGKPSWISNDQAIWWVPEFSEWGIGNLDWLESVTRGLTGVPSDKNDFGWPYDQKYTWKYWTGSGFTTPGANDIKVQCKGQECTATIVSSNTTKWCVFPFIYSGKTYEECTVDDSENSKPWCAYEVDDQRNVVRGKWADCNPECLEGGIHPTSSPEISNGCCSVGKIICIESCDTGVAMLYSELYEEYVMQVQKHNEKSYYQSRDGKHALSWHESGVWNLGTADQLGTAWAWSKDNVSCPYEITNWEYWDSNSQVQKASGTLEFDCITPSSGF